MPKTGSGAYLYEPSRYINFFRKLKRAPDGRSPADKQLVVSAIAAPTDHVEVSPLVEKCPPEVFSDASGSSCGATCPCWRIVKAPSCRSVAGMPPYSIEILHETEVAKGTWATVGCASSLANGWGTDAFAALEQCR